MSKEVFVSFEVAKLLKEKGFDWECSTYLYTINVYNYGDEPCRFQINDSKNSELASDKMTAPTQQMAMRWLIKTHNIHIEPHFLRESGNYVYNIIHSPFKLDDIHSFPIVFNTREDAVEAALEYCLTNLI